MDLIFGEQLEHSIPLTLERINGMSERTKHRYIVGDYIVQYGVVTSTPDEFSQESVTISINVNSYRNTLIELDGYHYDFELSRPNIPVFRK